MARWTSVGFRTAPRTFELTTHGVVRLGGNGHTRCRQGLPLIQRIARLRSSACTRKVDSTLGYARRESNERPKERREILEYNRFRRYDPLLFPAAGWSVRPDRYAVSPEESALTAGRNRATRDGLSLPRISARPRRLRPVSPRSDRRPEPSEAPKSPPAKRWRRRRKCPWCNEPAPE